MQAVAAVAVQWQWDLKTSMIFSGFLYTCVCVWARIYLNLSDECGGGGLIFTCRNPTCRALWGRSAASLTYRTTVRNTGTPGNVPRLYRKCKPSQPERRSLVSLYIIDFLATRTCRST